MAELGLKDLLESVRQSSPRVHCITNYVTANDCANILLACGASPIMADSPEESGEITALCSGLVINLGTLSPRKLEAMLISGKKANELAVPAVFDPVGVGASQFRSRSAKRLLSEVRFSIIRGNLSEIKTLSGLDASFHGVDSADVLTEDAVFQTARLAAQLSRRTEAVTVVTGETDIVSDGISAYSIKNGRSMMSGVTGSGCMLSSLTGAFAAAAPNEPMKAAAAAVCAMGVCGELAAERLSSADGNAVYRNYIIDAVYRLNGEVLEKRARIELIPEVEL